MRKAVYFTIFLFVCMSIFCGCSGANPRVKELYEQFEGENSLHEKIGYYREFRQTLDPGNKKEMEYNSKAWDTMYNIFRYTPPWVMSVESLTEEDVEWLAADKGLALSSFTPDVGMAIDFDGAFYAWGRYLAAKNDADIHTQTVEDQFIGVRNMAVLYSFDSVKNYRDIHNTAIDPISRFNEVIKFWGDVPHLDLEQKEPLPSGSDNLKILILLSSSVNNDWYNLEARLMIETLPPDMFPENAEDIDILILITENRGWQYAGRQGPDAYVEVWGTSSNINAFDFKTGYHISDIEKDFGSIESFLKSVTLTP